MKGLLKRAAESKEVLEMIYLNTKGEISQRRIKVIKLNEESFSAYCFTRKQQRTFKISNVLSVGPVRKVRRGA
jgi:predicted DNA-binding transcriptional regulator YafY